MITVPALVVPTAVFALLLVTLQAGVPDASPYRVRTTDATELGLRIAQVDVWSEAERIDWGTAPWPTSFRALRTEAALWLRFDAVDPAPWHTYTERDDPLWEEEVVEIFIDPDGDGRNYVEIEVSPANVVCDLLMERGDPDKLGHLDWDFPGLQTWKLHWVEGHKPPAGWIIVARLPWEGFRDVPGTDVALPPRPGDRWSFNVFRIKRPGGPAAPDEGLVLDAWSPVPGGSFHVPEVFRPMEFE